MKQVKKLLALLLCLILVVSSLSACGENANSTQGGNESGDASQGSGSEEAGTDGDIIVASSTLGSTLDPMDNTDAISSSFLYGTYERLVKYGTKEENGVTVADTDTFEPSLAERWEVSDDQLTWTFYLDQDAKFANGDPVTAEDVIWSFEYCRDNVNSEFVFSLLHIENMTAVDEYTVQFDLSSPCNMFLKIIEMYTGAIINKDEVEANGGYEYLKDHTAGSGPYEITTYDTNTEVTLTRRDDYWGTAPSNHSITYRKVAEESNRQLLLEQGDVDMALNIGEKNLETLANMDGISVQTNSIPQMMYLAMNQAYEPFDDVKVRQAIAYALPYESMVNDVMYGRANMVDSSCIPSVMEGQASGTGFTQDMEKAKQLLAESSHPDGFEIELLVGSGFQDWQDCAVLIQDALKELNITVTIRNVDRSQFLEMIAQDNVPFFITRVLSYVNDPEYLTGMILQSEGNFNYYNYKSAEFDELYAAAQATTDNAERMDYFRQLQELVQQDAPIAPIYEYSFNMCYSDEVSGYIFYPDSTLRFETLQK